MPRLTYLEIPATDKLRAARFYEAVVGWTIELRPDGDPRFAADDAHLIGRWTTERAAASAPGAIAYYTVDSVEGSVARVAAAGGAVETAPHVEGDVLMARVRDPDGNVIGIWQFAPGAPRLA